MPLSTPSNKPPSPLVCARPAGWGKACLLGAALGWAVLLGLSGGAQPACAQGQHGLALGAPLKYREGFSHFDYAGPQPPKGGGLTMGALGSFDTLNPFSLKGRPPLMEPQLVYDTLMTASWDEPFSRYGLLARGVQVAPDGMSVVFHLNPQARFSDGHPVTAEDVVFSFQVLRSPAAQPVYRFYYADIKRVAALDKLTVRVEFSAKNRELPLVAGDLPILPRHIYGQGDFQTAFTGKAVGSGPYTIEAYAFGKYLRYKRNPHYWAAGLNVNRGRYNFDTVTVKFYRDATVQLEGLKAGEFDFHWLFVAKQWAKDAQGAKWDKGYLVKTLLKHSNIAGIQGYVFNLKKPVFADRRVRKALALAQDFEWSNRALFYGQYTEMDAYFDNSELAAEGLPGKDELALLEPLRGKLPPEVFTQPKTTLSASYPNQRAKLAEAKRLLNEAGWRVKDGALTHQKTGERMELTITLVQPEFQRVVEPWGLNLKKLGISLKMKVVDESVYEKLARNKDYEMMVSAFGQSLSPGNEQMGYWHSSSAGVPGSFNAMALKDPAIDQLVEKLVRAPDRKSLVTATRALDRALWYGYYLVPHWYIGSHRVTYWNRFGHPDRLPLYYNPYDYLTYWWADPARQKALAQAQAHNQPLARP